MIDDFQNLLIPETEIDINLLDNLVQQYNSNPSNNDLHKIMISFSQRPDSWKCFQEVLENDVNPKTKFIVLQSLRNFISYRWESLDESEKGQMNQILLSFLENNIQSAPQYMLSMLDQCIVMILKYEWPQNMPTFIPEIVHQALEDPIKTKNTLAIFEILAHEISVEAENTLTVMRSDLMTEQFSNDFGEISQLIQTALNSDPTEEVIKDCLSAIRSFIPLINLDFIFQMGIFSNLMVVFDISPHLFIEASSIYGEIAQTTTFPQEFTELVPSIFEKILESFQQYNTDDFLYSQLNEDEQILFSRTLTSLVSKYYKIMLEKNHKDQLNSILDIISNMTVSYSGEAFQNCIEFWVQIAKTTYGEQKCHMDVTTAIFIPFFQNMMNTIVNRIVPPYQLLKVEEEAQNDGQYLINVTPSVLYEAMRDFLVYSMIIIPENTTEAITLQFEEELSADQINSICWSTGAIGGVLDASEEQPIISPIIESLFNHLEHAEDDVKYSIIAGLVFISGTLKNFFELEDNISILSNIVELAFSVFPELDEEQQIIIATYFKKTSRLSAAMLNNTPSGKSCTILQGLCQAIIETFPNICPQAALITLDCITTAMKQIKDKAQKGEMLSTITHFIVQSISDLQKDSSTPLINYIFFIRCLKVFPFNIGNDYLTIFLTFSDILVELYATCTANLNEEVYQVRSELLDLFGIMSSQISPRDPNIEQFFELCISTFLNDYSESEPQYRDTHVLLIFGHIALKTQSSMPERIGMYYSKLFEPTAVLFDENVIDYIDFSIPLLFLMKSIIRTSLPSLISLGDDNFSRFLAIINALITSPSSDVCDSALGILQDLLTSIEHVPQTFSQQFYNDNAVRYALDIIRYLATPQMRSSFGALTAILKRLLKLQVVTENIHILANSIVENFPGHTQSEIEQFLIEIKSAMKPMEFKQKLRNFLVTVRVYSHRDPVLYKDEIQEEKKQRMQERLEVPGLVEGELEKSDIDKQLDDLSGKVQNMNMSQK